MGEKEKKFDVDQHLKEVAEMAKNAPEPEEILAEFERSDYSSLDPQFIEDNAKKEKIKKNKKSAFDKEPETSL